MCGVSQPSHRLVIWASLRPAFRAYKARLLTLLKDVIEATILYLAPTLLSFPFCK